MKFAYQRYEVEPSAVFSGGVLYRPEVRLRVMGQLGDANLFALVDTGADGTLVPRSIGERIGVAIDDSQGVAVSGFSGQQMVVAPGQVTLELRQGDQYCRWEATIGFVSFATPEAEQAVLGHGAGLDYFLAVFDGEKRQLELTPNGRFPGQMES